jgi:hypothetical protein
MLESHFSAYPCIGTTTDPHRERPVRVFDISEPTLAGVSDSVDAWIVPMGARINGIDVRTMFLNPQQTGVTKRARKQLINTEAPSPPVTPRPRRTLNF